MRQGEGKSPCEQRGPFPLSAQLLRETNSLTLTLFAANSGPLPSPPPLSHLTAQHHLCPPLLSNTHWHPNLQREGGVWGE